MFSREELSIGVVEVEDDPVKGRNRYESCRLLLL